MSRLLCPHCRAEVVTPPSDAGDVDCFNGHCFPQGAAIVSGSWNLDHVFKALEWARTIRLASLVRYGKGASEFRVVGHAVSFLTGEPRVLVRSTQHRNVTYSVPLKEFMAGGQWTMGGRHISGDDLAASEVGS